MKRQPYIPDGVWPTMITPYTHSNQIDYEALEALIEWYIRHHADGLFAVCQSSEMFFLSLDEKVELAQFVKKKAAGRVPVIASGHTADTMEEQIEEIQAISAAGVDAFVLVSNRLAGSDENDLIWQRNTNYLLARIPDIPLGLYECPYPYKRLLTPELLKWCAGTGQFRFLKDTCCDPRQLRLKIDAVRGTPLKIFNANSSTLLESLKMGASGFSGVMANFHPQVYAWLVNNWRQEPEKAERVQELAGTASLIELQNYPLNAKYHLQLEGVPVTSACRIPDKTELKPNQQREVEQLNGLCKTFFKNLDRVGWTER